MAEGGANVIFRGMATHPFRGGFWNEKGKLKRKLRYLPEWVVGAAEGGVGEGQNKGGIGAVGGGAWGFMVRNGEESFNRPLYGWNNAFRVDGGDRPEWSFYFPGRGGVVRVGVVTGRGAKWLRECADVVTRYVDARLVHEVRDGVLGDGMLRVVGIAMAGLEGLLLRVEWGGSEPVELVVGYGGATGQRAARDGDIGTEPVPMTEYFALKAEHCRGNRYEVNEGGWMMVAPSATVGGVVRPGSQVGVADGREWERLEGLLGSVGRDTETPVVVGRVKVMGGSAEYVAVQRVTSRAPSTQPVREMPALLRYEELGKAWEEADAHSRKIARLVEVETPDHFFNSAVAALCVAADGVFDGASQSYMHGAVAWRRSYLGWRGAYAGDALGQHERTRSHLERWLTKQNTNPPRPDQMPGTGADEDTLLSRSKRMLHSSGDLTATHYDMNTVAFDALYRHLRWTGDLEYARQRWEVIKRHLEWQKRLFRREFKGGGGMPEGVLYEAYACIWASDDLQYSGGGVTHACAYQAFSLGEAARLAKLLGEDPTPYEKERAAILEGMEKLLWLKEKGWYAEYKDWLGERMVHERPAVWTHYHTMDGEFVEPRRAWEMTEYIEHEIPHIPLDGEEEGIEKGVPEGFYQISTTNWMPYTWSINNVVFGETIHTALAGFQAGRIDQGYRLMKGAILDHMFMGICPGNVGMASYYDAYRRESQRDFSDAVGIFSRCVMEGVFGVKMDRLAGELTVKPGWPEDWNSARLRHPELELAYERKGEVERFEVRVVRGGPVRLRLRTWARTLKVGSVTVNGAKGKWKCREESVGGPEIEVECEKGEVFDVRIEWRPFERASVGRVESRVVYQGEKLWDEKNQVAEIYDPQGIFDRETGRVVTREVGRRMYFTRVREGDMAWWEVARLEVRPQLELKHLFLTEGMVHFQVLNNSSTRMKERWRVAVGHREAGIDLEAGPNGHSGPVEVAAKDLLPGTHRIELRDGKGNVFGERLADWSTKPASGVRFEAVSLGQSAKWDITKIFQQEYLSPRSPFCSLSIPKHGLGGWCTYRRSADISDAVLKTGRVATPWGFAFETQGTMAAMVSQWENHPKEITIPLSGKARHLYLLMAGSTNHMQCHVDNGVVEVEYAGGEKEQLVLRSPENWWPVNEDFAVDDYQFRLVGNIPPRVALRTGEIRIRGDREIRGQGGPREGGEANVIDLPLNETRELKSLKIKALANEAIIGLLSAVIAR